jgi:hypothetical protein
VRTELDTYLTGTLAGAGSFRCRQCGYAVALNALEEMPRCPSCGNARFARASMFDTSSPDETPTVGEVDDGDWLQAARDTLEEPGFYLAYRHDDGRVCLLPLVSEWTRIGRSLAADIRFDDPTVSRRHAIIAHQGDSVRVLDDRSLNGVFLKGDRVEWGELSDGDELIIGRYRLYFIEHAAESSSAESDITQAAA